VERLAETEGCVLVVVVPLFKLSETLRLHSLRDVVLRRRKSQEFDVFVAFSIEEILI
jgi:hypothetical protein